MIYLLENYIYNIIKENETIKKELHIFDFDMTLYDPHKGEWLENVVEEARKQIANKDSITALCTARTKNKSTVTNTINLLRSKGLRFDYYTFKPSNIKMTAPEYKSKAVNKMIKRIKRSEELSLISFWDDRQDNLDEVESLSIQHKINYKSNKT